MLFSTVPKGSMSPKRLRTPKISHLIPKTYDINNIIILILELKKIELGKLNDFPSL